MSTYINSAFTSGYGLYLSSQNPVTIGSSGYITNIDTSRFFGDAIYGSTAAAWVITNSGIVDARYGTSAGIDLRGGGIITNTTGALISGVLDGVFITGSVGTVTNAAGATIAGGLNGIYLLTAAGTVSNSGTIEAAATDSHGIYLATAAAGPDITNAQGGLISGGFDGIRVRSDDATVTNSGIIEATAPGGAGVAMIGTAGSVSNAGTIRGTGAQSYGVVLFPAAAASNVTNELGALISGRLYGVALLGAGMVTNFGTIQGTGSGTLGTGAYLNVGGLVINASSGLLSGYYDGALVQGGSASAYGTVVNYGTVLGTGARADGVRLATYGDVINHTGGLIRGILNGVEIDSRYGILVNYGTAAGAGTHSTGVYFAAGGAVINDANALLSGSYDGAFVQGSAGDYGLVTNRGTIEGTGTGADGVRLAAYGYVANQAGGLIRGTLNGVEINSAYGILSNSGTIAGASAGAFMHAGTVVNGATNAISALISGVNYGIVMAGTAASTVTNYGTIASTGSPALNLFPAGVNILGFGVVVNGATNLTSALISGSSDGVSIDGTGATVSNFGTILGTGTDGDGVYLAPDGAVAIDNAASGLIAGGFDGISIHGTASATTVSNLGTILGSGKFGVYLAAAGGVAIDNAAASGLISGGYDGISIHGTAAATTVSNLGTIQGYGTSGDGVYLGTGGSVVIGNEQNALIWGGYNGIVLFGTSGTVNNFGTILGTGTNGDGVYLAPVGAVAIDNAASGLIAGGFDGISIHGTAAATTVSNFGTIQGTSNNGIYLFAAGGVAIDNAAASGLIAGAFDGISIHGTAPAATVSNLGTIQGYGTNGDGVYLGTGGSVVIGNEQNALISGDFTGVALFGTSGTVNNFGTILGTGTDGDGVYLHTSADANVSNAAGGLILGAYDGVVVAAGTSTVSNFGTIQGTDDVGIVLSAPTGASTVINGATGATSALISGNLYGLLISSAAGTVINYGDVVATAATGTGIYLSFGTVTNFGTVVAGANGTGIYLYGGNVTNSGTIVAPAATAVIVRYGTFFNAGLVEGAVSGIELSLGTGTAGTGAVNVSGTVIGATGISVAPTSTAGQTVTVYGTVIGTSGTAVSLTTGGSDRLVVAPGAAFTGFIDGGGGTSVLEITGTFASGLGGSGMVQGLGTVAYVGLGSITNFSALAIDPSVTFGGSGALTFPTLVNEGQVNVGPGNSLALGVASAAGGGIIDLQAGGTIDFQGAVSNQIVIFQPPGGVAEIDHPELFSGTLSGFTGTGDIVDLTQFSPAGATATLNGSDQLVVTNGAQSVSLQLDTGESYTGIRWDARADHNGTGNGTEIVPVCFCRGTLILTDRGEVAVERLAVGDRVVTLGGAAAPIQWIGFGRDLVTGKNSLARPIVVRAGALADAVPRRDLYLTHGHALYLDGALIPVENLVNHRSILWDEAARVVEYYHIELAGHDVVFAEGAPAESYYDAGNRALFQNARQGSQAGAATSTFAPVLTDGDIVEKVWAALDRRAGGRHDGDTTDDPDLHLVIAGARLDPVSRAAGVYTFSVDRAPAGPLLLRSRSGVPSLTGLGRHDHRRLGVAIRQIILCAAGVMTSLDRDAPHFRDGGCHLPEAGHSWTDGELSLPAALFGHLTGAFTLVVHTKKEAMRYPIATAAVQAA